MPVYVVEDSRKVEKTRLVRATVGHIAERHVIGKYVHARVASKDDLIDLITDGVRVEDAATPEDPGQESNGNSGGSQGELIDP